MPGPPQTQERILVIKLGALGDVIQALGPMRAIRDHHPDAHITCLTARAFHDLIEASGLCDAISIDNRPGAFDVLGWMQVRRDLRRGGFTRVYDLQTSGRSSRYYTLHWPGPYPEWSGIAKDCSHPHANPDRDSMHTLERQSEQLQMAGIPFVPPPSIDGMGEDVSRFGLPDTFCLIVPGGAQHRPEKRWPTENYRELVARLAAKGLCPVVIGTKPEHALATQITDGIDGTLNLVDQTGILAVVALAKRAAFAVGNDSGPMHIAAVAGIPSVVLYSHASDPALCAQRGPNVTILRRSTLSDLSVEEVSNALPVSGP